MTALQNPPATVVAPLMSDALDALTAADTALASATGLMLVGPHTVDVVTAAWLTETIGSSVPGAKVLDALDVDRHAGMTDRLRLSVIWNEVGVAAGLPAHVFLKATPVEPHHLLTLSVLHMHELEVRFYTDVQPELPALAPRAFHAESHPGGRFLLVLEDLADRDCQPFWLKDTCTPEHAKAVARALATLHATYWESPRFESDLSWVRPRTQRFGWSWLCGNLGGARDSYLATEAGRALPPEALALTQAWREHQDAIFDYWETLPRTLLHGDSHFGNTFATSDGEAGFFDWQVIFRGHGLRDLAYFLLTALPIEQRREHEAEVLDIYLAGLAAGGVEIDREFALRHFALFALDMLDASMATLAHGSYNHDLAVTQRNLDNALSMLLDHDVLSHIHAIVRAD
ncbi:phosphotransferase [Nocardioides pacificus]